jgi:CO/xanthine dehydrogenase FAD-binding subunit
MRPQGPQGLEAALAALAAGGWQVLAGGTDFYPARGGRPVIEPLLDICGLDELQGIAPTHLPDGSPAWRLGAATTWRQVAEAVARQPALTALAQAAVEVGGAQIQNQGTLGGNLCNASPAADGVPVLLALDAQVELAGRDGRRLLPLADFVLGPRRTARRPDELMLAVWLPRRSEAARSRFVKLGHRRYLVIAIIMAALAFDFDAEDRLSVCGLAVGAAGPVACRLSVIEAGLLGTPRARLPGRMRELLTHPAALAPLSPIDDLRGSAAYRLQAARELVARLVVDLAGDAR